MLGGVAAALTPVPAFAGAWQQADELIVSAASGEQGGQALREAGIAWEHSLSARSGVVVHAYAAGGRAYGGDWTGEAVVAGKWLLVQDGPMALSLQGGIVAPLSPLSACKGAGAELRALAGRSFGAAFVDIQAAYRLQNAACAHARLDATLGWRPSARWLTMVQVFADRDLRNEHIVKAQISMARFTTGKLAVQIGARARADKGEFRDSALVVALWRTL